MKAIGVIPKERRLGMLRHPHPEIRAAEQVLVRTIEVGVCGTDREIATFAYGTPPQGSDYLIVGHEAVGQVTAIGPEVTRVKVGDLVVPSVRRPCSHDSCRPCAGDRQDFCATGDFVERGIKEAHGFMTQYFVEHEKFLYAVPENLRDIAVLVEPLTVAEKAIAQVFQVQRRLPWTGSHAEGTGKTAVVLGAGPIGILGAMAFVLRGFRTFVYSRSPAPNLKAEVCASFGATYVSSAEVGIEELSARVGNIDVVYEALGSAGIAFDVMARLGLNGVFVFTGIPPAEEPPISLRADALMRDMVLKNQMIVGTVNADHASFEAAIRDLAECKSRWPEAIGRVITGRHPIEAYNKLLTAASSGIKDVIVFA